MRQLAWPSLMSPGGEGVDGGAVVVCAGARAAQDALFAQARGLQDQMRSDPALLRKPVLIVVSSGALREQLIGRLTAHLGGAAVGLAVITLRALAARVLREPGASPAAPARDALFEILVRREAAENGELSRVLGDYEDGYALAAASVRDLLSAGFVASDAEILQQVWEETRPSGARLAGAVVHTCARVRAEMERHDVMRSGDLLVAAALEIASRGAAALDARAVLIHGFSDATGQATQLLQQVVRCGGRVYVSQPPSTAEDETEEHFSQPLIAALKLSAPLRRGDATANLAEVDLFDAAGAAAETTEVVHRIGELSQRGVRWEEIAVVTRDLPRYALAMRQAFSERGVPFSGGTAPRELFGWAQRWGAALELLLQGEGCTVDRWLDARLANSGDSWTDGTNGGGAPGPAVAQELRWALRAFGVARLRDLCVADVGSRSEGDAIRTAVESGRVLCAHIASWPDRAPVALHADWMRRTLVDLMGWPERPTDGASVSPDWAESVATVGRLAADALELTRAEFFWLLHKHQPPAPPLGGVGGGVQVLDVTHARGLTFEHVFVVGLNRGVFPRVVSEDPLLSDRARRAFAAVLPDLQAKSWGHVEERHLFDELLSSTRHVTLSWLREDGDGQTAIPSALLGRLGDGWQRRVAHLPAGREARLMPPFSGGRTRPRTAAELMQLAGIQGDRAGFARLAPLQLIEGRMARGVGGGEEVVDRGADAIGAARASIVERRESATLDADLGTVGTRLGFVGSLESADDPRHDPLFITTLETYAGCPWRALLARLLRLRPPRDPLARLPGIDAQLVGTAVHHTLERLLRPSTRQGRRANGAVERPAGEAVVETTLSTAHAVAVEAGLRLPALQRALGRLALPLVQKAIEIDWPHARARVHIRAVEQTAEVSVERGSDAGQRAVAFRVDRIDQCGALRVLTDYKSGRPPSRARRSATRERALKSAVLRGERLQIAAYAAVPGQDDTVGRYLFLDPSTPLELADVRLEGSDDTVQRELPRLLRLLVGGWERGIFLPRLEDAQGREPERCRRCEVAEACVRGDSGARLQLRRFAAELESRRKAGVRLPEQLRLWNELWRLGGGGDETARP